MLQAFKVRPGLAVLLLPMAAGGLATGCTRGEPGEIDSYKAKGAYIRSLPEEPKAYPRNPNPKQAYEVTVTLTDPPGPMVLRTGFVQYDARDCVYVTNRWAGSSAWPQELERIAFSQVDATTWRAVFHTDAMLDQDYDGPDGPMAPCHWKLMEVSARLSASGAPEDTVYVPWINGKDVAPTEGSTTRWFTVYGYPRMPGGRYLSYGRSERPKLPESDYFSITLSTKRLDP